MNKRITYSRLLILSFYSLSLLASGVCANLDGYIVEPVKPDMDIGTDLETDPVDFPDLPLEVKMFALAILITSMTGFPLQLFISIKLYAYLGYRKVTKTEMLDNDNRNLIYQCIRDNPGINYTSIGRKTNIKHGTLGYHLCILRAFGKISVMENHGHSRYFVNSGTLSEMEKTVLKYIQNSTDYRILKFLIENPGAVRKDIEKKIGISGPLVTWYMKRLNGDGIISIHKMGKTVHYEINQEVRKYLEIHCSN
jgi:predicted transcriptional regulator